MAATRTAPLNHQGLKASLRAASLREEPNHSGGQAYSIACPDDVLAAIGAFRQRYQHTPGWFEWTFPTTLTLGPLP